MEVKDRIFELCLSLFQAEQERKAARKLRNSLRKGHPCMSVDGETDNPCWAQSDLPADKWCDNCKTVQPYYLDYRARANRSRAIQLSITTAIRKFKNSEKRSKELAAQQGRFF